MDRQKKEDMVLWIHLAAVAKCAGVTPAQLYEMAAKTEEMVDYLKELADELEIHQKLKESQYS